MLIHNVSRLCDCMSRSFLDLNLTQLNVSLRCVLQRHLLFLQNWDIFRVLQLSFTQKINETLKYPGWKDFCVFWRWDIALFSPWKMDKKERDFIGWLLKLFFPAGYYPRPSAVWHGCCPSLDWLHHSHNMGASRSIDNSRRKPGIGGMGDNGWHARMSMV